MNKCVLCGVDMPDDFWPNNPEPLCSPTKGGCCDKCDKEKVIPARIKEWKIEPYYSALKEGDKND